MVLLMILSSEVCVGELHPDGDLRGMLMWPEEKGDVPKHASQSQGT